jgi:hypothetical protein
LFGSARQLVAGHAGHIDVRNQDFDLLITRKSVEGFDAVARGSHIATELLNHFGS